MKRPRLSELDKMLIWMVFALTIAIFIGFGLLSLCEDPRVRQVECISDCQCYIEDDAAWEICVRECLD